MNQDRWTAVTCLVIAVAIILAIPSQTSDRPLPGARGFDKLDGAFFPEIAVTLFIIAAIWLFIEARPRKAAASGTGAAEDDQPPGMTLRDLVWAVALSGGMLVYVQFLNPLGYLICTVVGVSILAFICG
jgi:Tripartite tricarboxylate transporter TctB family